VVAWFVGGGAVTICHDGEESALHDGFVSKIEASFGAESLYASFCEISARSSNELRRILGRSAMLF
jgi:hypothetical protein